MPITVAIIGRPNVGKSTLFNRLVGKRLALVDDTPGVTRDRRMAEAKIADLKLKIIDTAGLEEAGADTLEGRMRAQTEEAIWEADVSFFVIDARAGVTPADKAFANLLRKAERPVILVANKVEGNKGDSGYYESFGMGFGDPVPISAEHGEGIYDLRDALVEKLGESILDEDEKNAERDQYEVLFEEQAFESEAEEEAAIADEAAQYQPSEKHPLRIAVVGRPNAGKSTLINHMIDQERLLTGPEAGITRDSISVEWQWNDVPVKLYDTAGMRKRARVQEKLEKLSVADGLRAVQFAEVVVILLDATIPYEKQDLHIVDLIVREGRAPVIAYNKWDLVEDRDKLLKDLREKTNRLLPQISGVKTVTLSGIQGKGIDRLMQAIMETYQIWNKRISTAKLNNWLSMTQVQHPPPAVRGRRIRIKYITQIKTRPPTFMVHCNHSEQLPTSYVRYLSNSLRQNFGITGVPIRMLMRKGDNPYAGRKKRNN